MLKTIKGKLIACIAGLGLALAAVGLCGVISLKITSAKIDTIVADRVVPAQQLNEISDAYAASIVDTAWRVQSGQLQAAEGVKRIDAAVTTLHRDWDAYSKTSMTPEEKAMADEAASVMGRADAATRQLRAIIASGDMAALTAFTARDLYPAIDPVAMKMSALLDLQIRVAKEEGAAANKAANMAQILEGAIGLFALLIFGVALNTVIRGVTRPLLGMTATMHRLAGGDNEVEVPAVGRQDELGQMAAAVLTFKENAIQRARLEAEAAEFQKNLDRKLRETEAAFEAAGQEQSRVVKAMAAQLQRLSQGDLTAQLSDPVAADYDALKADFNRAVSGLQTALTEVTSSAGQIRTGSSEISQAADDLSHRTEQQAANLEETAAALDQITATVRKTAESADHARLAVSQAKTDAERSGEVVGDAVAAMSEIEKSSSEINQIISVIDEIAFQTNLLALNAGVEAARAGEAGRGFAVVASEVRALAQRSADAAREIKSLISASTRHVEQGVRLIGETGDALGRIVEQIVQINGVVTDIASSAQEQSTGLQQVNIAVNQMDQMTQQNAAMVEESTAASHSLRSEADGLTKLISRFKIDASAVPAPAERPAPRPARAAIVGNTARKLEPAAEAGWQEV